MGVEFRLGRTKFREQVRRFLDENYPEDMRRRKYEWPFSWDFNKALAAWRQANVEDRDPFDLIVLHEECQRAGVASHNNPTFAIAETLQAIGTEYHKREFVPKMLAGEMLISLGYSEPDSGSDVAAAKTRAVRDGEEWIINGQKAFTSMAEIGSHVFLLTRTNPNVPKHRGLTTFIVALDSPGVEVGIMRTLSEHPTNMTFYSDVHVPDSCRVGAIDG